MGSQQGGIIEMFNLNSIILGKKKFVNSKIRICVECGSTQVLQNQKIIMCRDCGDVKGVDGLLPLNRIGGGEM